MFVFALNTNDTVEIRGEAWYQKLQSYLSRHFVIKTNASIYYNFTKEMDCKRCYKHFYIQADIIYVQLFY